MCKFACNFNTCEIVLLFQILNNVDCISVRENSIESVSHCINRFSDNRQILNGCLKTSFVSLQILGYNKTSSWLCGMKKNLGAVLKIIII